MRITRILLRLASVPVAILAIANILLTGWAAYLAVTRVYFRDWVLAPILAGIAVLCIRVIVWLWLREPFWRRATRTAEVAAVVVLALLVPIMAHLETRVSGGARATLQSTAIVIPLVAYIAARYWHRRVARGSPQRVGAMR